jgi:hypothetical protein
MKQPPSLGEVNLAFEAAAADRANSLAANGSGGTEWQPASAGEGSLNWAG